MRKILYIEDDKDISGAVRLMLKSSGFDVETAFSGKQGLNLIKKNDFDLILLDIMLPDMSGWDIFATLREKTKAKFAFLSALPVNSERMEELRKVGVSDYITKPFTKESLVKRISSIFGKKILYVEDDEDTALAVQMILNSAGYETKVAYCGTECIKKIKQGFDLILLDLMLPDMSGWDIFELFKEKTQAKFAFLSAVEANAERKKELQRVGIMDYITKPFTKENLIKRITNILENPSQY